MGHERPYLSGLSSLKRPPYIPEILKDTDGLDIIMFFLGDTLSSVPLKGPLRGPCKIGSEDYF